MWFTKTITLGDNFTTISCPSTGFRKQSLEQFYSGSEQVEASEETCQFPDFSQVSRFMFSPPRPLDQLHYRPVLLNLTLKEMMMCGIFSLKTNILHGMQEILQPGWRRLLHLFIANITMGCNKTYDCHHMSGSGFHIKPLKPKVK